MRIERFVPLPFKEVKLDIKTLQEEWGVENNVLYASKGQYAIIHILRSLRVNEGTILISSYMCPTVKEALIKYHYNVEYFDINIEDLNPSVEDIEIKLKKQKIAAVVVPSLYGNPADLCTIHKICQKYGVYMIDDAAQSFGAEIDGKKVGSFGDGGFMAFSPGKPTAGHMGAFFWSKKTDAYCIERTTHFWVHFFIYLDFFFCRYKVYATPKCIRTIIGIVTSSIVGKVDIFYDDIEDYEKKKLGGIIVSNKEYKEYRNSIVLQIESLTKNKRGLRVIKNLRGIQNNSKVVFVLEDINLCKRFIDYLKERNISYFGGYALPEGSCKCENCKKIVGTIVELPIEVSRVRMQYIIETIDTFVKLINE